MTKAQVYAEIAKNFSLLAEMEGGDVSADVEKNADEGEAPDYESMSAKELKALCTERGIETGKKADMIAALRAADESDDSEEEEDEENVTAEADDESDEEDSDEEEDDSDGDEIHEQVLEATEGISDKELKDFCKDAGISTKGGREAMLSKIEEAVRAGDIDLSDDEEEEDESDDDSDEEVEYTDEHNEGVEKMEKRVRTALKKGKLNDKKMKKFLSRVGEDSDLDGDELVEAYVEAKAMFVDDDGDEHDFEDAYELNGEPYCCGRPLTVKDGEGVCDVCGEEYPLDDEE